MIGATTETSLVSSIWQQERRASPRFSIAKPVLACPFGPEYKEEVQTTLNTSRDGLYFETRSKHYLVGMPVSVMERYALQERCNPPSFGKVVRIDRLKNGNLGIAVHVLMR